MLEPNLTRRKVLQLAAASSAAAGLTVYGVAISQPAPDPIELISYRYGDDTMTNRLLIAYASATGTTMEIAAEMGRALNEQGHLVDVVPIKDNPSLNGYQAVLIGSAVQHGEWLPEAIDFVADNQSALEQLPVGVFCVHIRNTGHDENSRREREAYLNPVRALITPMVEGYFAGRFDRRGAYLMLPRWIAPLVPTTDLREMSRVRRWAQQLTAMF
ncbi:MAG: twin-arginine translocation signal domain-containing protein [Chloroflexi bacterium]|nr:twin-arginine translocation signal domain-containing protein [Chloroflexota bacterium]